MRAFQFYVLAVIFSNKHPKPGIFGALPTRVWRVSAWGNLINRRKYETPTSGAFLGILLFRFITFSSPVLPIFSYPDYVFFLRLRVSAPYTPECATRHTLLQSTVFLRFLCRFLSSLSRPMWKSSVGVKKHTMTRQNIVETPLASTAS